jgi:hypothetical protein
MLSLADQIVLDVFRRYLVTSGEMLCFHGKWLEEHGASLRRLTAIKLITKEDFQGGYSLTDAGYAAVQNTDEMTTSDKVTVT